MGAGGGGAEHGQFAGRGGEQVRGQRARGGAAAGAVGVGGGGGGGAVQQQVEAGSGEPGEAVGVAQRFDAFGGTGPGLAGLPWLSGMSSLSGRDRVPDRADPQPPVVLVRAQRLGEPGRLLGPEPAVAVLGPMGPGHRGVEPGDDGAEFGHREERPRLGAVEDHVQALVELLEQPGVVPPLGPVRRGGPQFVGLAGGEVGTGGGLADVLAAGQYGHPVRFEPEQGADPGEEGQRLLALAGAAGGGEVAGDDDEFGRGGAGVGEFDEVAPEGRLEVDRVGAPAEGGAGQVEDGDRLASGGAADGLRVLGPGGGAAAAGPAGVAARVRGGGEVLGAAGAGACPRRGAVAVARVAGGQLGAGPALHRLGDPGQQQPPGAVGLGDADQVDVGEGGEQAVHRDVLDPDRHQPPFRLVRVGAQRGLPLHPAVAGALVVAREQRDHGGGLGDAPVHEVDEVRPGHEVPGLEEGPVARLLQGPGDPGRPALVGRGVADEEVDRPGATRDRVKSPHGRSL